MTLADPVAGIDLRAPVEGRAHEVITLEALAFVASLHREFDERRRTLLAQRRERQRELDQGALPDFLPATASIRDGDWRVPTAPADLVDRRVELTGPVDRKMVINALNSGARVFMADFEDANSPTWSNCVQGQINLFDAVRRTISVQTPERRYSLNRETATLVVRPRGWHLPEKHVLIDGEPISGALFDFGIWFFQNAWESLERGSGAYVYLPKLESHLEAALWHEVFAFSEDALGTPRGSIRATVLIETILAAFEMDEILHALGEHATGLNAGRWDYIFSVIKKLGRRPEFVLPDRVQITMTIPFMRAYTDLLVRTCHQRGAHAIGGMAAFIPSRTDHRANEVAFTAVREDKDRESSDGFDGTWVAHPDLVPIAMEAFDSRLGARPNQLERLREDVVADARDLLDVRVPRGSISREGLRKNIDVTLRYMTSWLRGFGAAAIHNLMEDAATAEISRSQVWQWVHHRVSLTDGSSVTRDLVRSVLEEVADSIRVDADTPEMAVARDLIGDLVLGADFVDFLTLPAYERLRT